MDKETLERYIAGTATPTERIKVVEWMDSDKENVNEFMALHKLHNIAVMNQVENLQPTTEKYACTPLWKKITRETLKIAATIIILLGLKAIWSNQEEISYQTIYVPAGQRAQLTLPDSTKVWLNSHTRLIYPLTFNKKKREVKLDGEAYFTVAHNKKPFIVKTKQIDVHVLGTEFNIKSYSETSKSQIELLKGSVELSGKILNDKRLQMKPKEKICIAENSITKSYIDDYDYFKWKEGIISFNNESVDEIINKLELYYDIRIEVRKKDFLKEHYSGKFRTKDGIEQVLKILQIEHKFTYTKDNSLNLIIIK